MSWLQLPPEIRTMILNTLIADNSCRLANAAAVSREWQAIIEPHTFSYIRVSSSHVAGLNPMTARNRGLVQSLWYCIELEPYDCTKCVDNTLSVGETSHWDNDIILDALRSLFSALSTWEPNGALTLDISLYSKSDKDHAFSYLTFEPDNPARGAAQNLLAAEQDTEGVKYKHRWQVRAEPGPLVPPDGMLERIFADAWISDDKDDFWPQVPDVLAVTRLVMRLQTHRRLQPETITNILTHLPRLREFHYEPWRHWYDEMQDHLDEDYLQLLTATRGLEKVTIFENFNQTFPHYFWGGSSLIRAPSVQLGQQLVRVNHGAKSLSVSYMVDAEDFFSAAPSIWPNLTYLALTSRLFAPETDPRTIMKLLRTAASAACRMPKLETMEIWNGLEGLAAVFKYEFVPGHRPSVLTWRGTWPLTLWSSVVSDWEEVVRVRDVDGTLDVVYELIEQDIASHADAIVHLKLSDMVIRPISLQQILREQSFIRSLTP